MGLHLDEKDARSLARHMVHALRSLGAHVERFGVHLEKEGFYFMARVNGRDVWVQTGQGNFRYERVAADLVHAAMQAPESVIRAEIVQDDSPTVN